jgi:hypothetical protein
MIIQPVALVASSIALLLNYPQAYEIKNFQGYRDLQMGCDNVRIQG